jgi:hypothetical protein
LSAAETVEIVCNGQHLYFEILKALIISRCQTLEVADVAGRSSEADRTSARKSALDAPSR